MNSVMGKTSKMSNLRPPLMSFFNPSKKIWDIPCRINREAPGQALTRLLSIMYTFLMILLLLGCGVLESSSTLPTPASPSKQIASNNLPLRELWRWSGIILGFDEPPLVVIKGEMIVVVSIIGRTANKIIVFETLTGRLVWESEPTFKSPHSIAVDDNNVYAGYPRYIQAYDLQTGKKLWVGTQQSKYKKGKLYVYPKEKQVEVYDASSEWPHDERVFILDVQTGETINTIEWSRIFFQDDNIVYNRTGPSEPGFGLTAYDKLTKEELWHLDTWAYPLRWPILIDDVMYLEAGDIYALDAKTGEVQWQSQANYAIDPSTGESKWFPENFKVPRIAYGADFLYTIRNDASIVGLDVNTGQEVGVIEIFPPPSGQRNEDGSIPNIYNVIAASDEFVAAYYYDSQELIVFEHVDNISE